MTPAIHVVAPGVMTTIQDLGRPGHQRIGIPVGGALDPVSLRAANALVGNAPGAGAIEILYHGPTLAIEAGDARFAFVGGNAAIEVLPDASASSGERIESLRSIRLQRGQIVKIGSLAGSSVMYAAVEGGFDIQPVLGSVSTYLRGGFGGFKGRALRAGDKLPLHRDSASDRADLVIEDLDISPPLRVRVVLGPQDDYFSDRGLATFLGSSYEISLASDRMGMKLDGPAIDHPKNYHFVSDGIALGSIQVPGNGLPIVLLADRQTTGGYPKIATVISADMPAVGRLRFGAKITFEAVTIEAAQAAYRELAVMLDGIGDKLAPLGRTDNDLTRTLLHSNLVSGVVDAYDGALHAVRSIRP
jgi:biotin-dependent carboxylase-like uncharacterized protein